MSWSGVKKQTNYANIESWCEEMGIENYTINNKGEIDVDGNVLIDSRIFNDIELPYKFGKVNGNFSLYIVTKLTSLKNCPYYVRGSFGCRNCPQLDSLEGCPKEVGKDFHCVNCKRKFMEKEVTSLCKVHGKIFTY